jgi:tetratricopeptide (TPR) repeat protein
MISFPRRHSSPWAGTVLGFLAFLLLSPAFVRAQMGPVLSPSYYRTIAQMYDGDYANALGGFENEYLGSIKIGTSRWLDSVCFLSMQGECHYRMGNLAKAAEAHGNALQLYLYYTQWMLNVQFPPQVNSSQPTKFPWGMRAPGSKISRLPETLLMQQGQPVTQNSLLKGGPISTPKLVSVPVQEIVRCVTLSIKRRREIQGPISPHDSLNNQVLEELKKATAPNNNWSRSWNDAMIGAALYATGNKGQAIALLKNSLLLGGELDHPITCYSLLLLGQIAFEDGKYDDAYTWFAQATLSAAEYSDYGVVEEGFRYCYLIHVIQNRKGVLAELAPATGWAKKVGGRELQASLLVLAAESMAVQRQTKPAQALLQQATVVMNRTPLMASEIGARLMYTTALTDYQAGRLADGDKAIATSLETAKSHSKWLYQLGVATARLTAPTPQLTEAKVLPIYERLADDPFPIDWAERPLDAILALSIPHQPMFELWFEIILSKNEWEKAFDIADKAKRHRLFNTLPLGGRLMAVRWLLEAPLEALDKDAQLQRREINARFPEYAKLGDAASKIKAQLTAMPLAPDKAEEIKKQADLMGEWYKLSSQQEALIREIALRREPTKLVFPPTTSIKSIQEKLPQGQVALVTYATSRNLHAVLLSKTRYASWRVENGVLLEKKMLAFLRAIGNYDANGVLTTAQLQDQSWKVAAREALDAFLLNSKVNFSQAFDELIIVPDGQLWYFPWEAAVVGDPPTTLLSKTRIRYAPTNGLIFNPLSTRSNRMELGVVLGKLHPRGEAKLGDEFLEKLAAKLPGAKQLKGGLNVPSPLFAGLLDQLIVLDDITTADRGGIDWSPTNLDKSGAGTLANWLQLPWKRTDVLILPGFHSLAETTIRDARLGNGSELFLSSCAMMATGARTVVLSRWRPGGASSYELARKFLQELPFAGAAAAWQRSVQLLCDTPLDFTHEPRVRAAANEGEMKADHPFFWAAFMVIDSGVLGSDQAAAAEAPPMVVAPKVDPDKPDAGRPLLPPLPGAGTPPMPEANPAQPPLPQPQDRPKLPALPAAK